MMVAKVAVVELLLEYKACIAVQTVKFTNVTKQYVSARRLRLKPLSSSRIRLGALALVACENNLCNCLRSKMKEKRINVLCCQ